MAARAALRAALAAAAAAALLAILAGPLAAAAAANTTAPPSNVMMWGEQYSDTAGQTVWEPVPLPGDVPFVEAASGTRFACMRTAEGQIYCIGSNGLGELGVGSDVPQTSMPLLVASDSRYSQVLAAAWGHYACGLVDAPGTPQDRTLECWCAMDVMMLCCCHACSCASLQRCVCQLLRILPR